MVICKPCTNFWRKFLKLEGNAEEWFALVHRMLAHSTFPLVNDEIEKGTRATSHFLTRQKWDLVLGWLSLLRWLTCWQSLKEDRGGLAYHTNLWWGSFCFISSSFLRAPPRHPKSRFSLLGPLPLTGGYL